MKEHGGTLARVRPLRLELFLQALANCTTIVHAQRLLKNFGDFFPDTFPNDGVSARQLRDLYGSYANKDWGLPEAAASPVDRMARVASLIPIYGTWAVNLRGAWDEPDRRRKEWFISELRRQYHQGTCPDHANEPPALTSFEQAMVHLQRIHERAKHCANPDCPKPYFIATKRSFKYCSPACSEPAQKKFKRDWWAENGAGWRKRRPKKTTKGGKHGK